MQSSCTICQTTFTNFNNDLELLSKFKLQIGNDEVEIPAPTLCPQCRAQRRLAWRNERKFFRSKSTFSEKAIISIFPPEHEIKSCSYDEWWSDAYDPLKYGRDFDFKRGFFEQFRELLLTVPQMAMIGSQNENSSYCHLVANCKNCYLLIESSNCEECYYSYWLQKCLSCQDSCFSHECSYCYEIDNCYNCYNLNYSKDCNNCSDSNFMQSCIGCSYCFGCVNLAHKEYHVYNKALSKAEYLKFIGNVNLGSRSEISKLNGKFSDHAKAFPRKYAEILKSENCSGNYIVSSKNCFNCYHAHDAEECRYGEHVWRNSKYNMDVSTVGRDAELVYESINTGISTYRVMFSIQCWTSSNLSYCYCCMNSKNSFGCVGLKNNNFCIFNKEYSESEYYQLLSKIVSHMQKSGEWGQFFPTTGSIFAYNDSSAQEQYPLSEQQANAKSYHWRKLNPQEYIPQAYRLADQILSVDQSALGELLSCITCKKNYKLISQELEFYKRYSIPAPDLCPDCRHEKRMKQRPAEKIYECECSGCKSPISSPHNSPSIKLLCEKCFANELG